MHSLERLLLAISRSIFRWKKIFIFEKKLTGTCFKIEAKVDVNVRLIQRDDFPKIAKKFKISHSDIKKRLEIGNLCFVADLHGDLAHFKWVAFNKTYSGDLERELRVGSNSALIYWGYTIPKYRGLGISPKVMEKILQHLAEIGIKKVYAGVDHNNFPMLRVKQKERFRKIGTITYTKLFKLRLYRCEGETGEDYNRLKEMFSL